MSKRATILVAAADLFLAKGFGGTSMDEVAAVASVSKQTVYKHFGDKQRLFREVVVSAVNEVSDPVYAEVLRLADSGNLTADLHDLAVRQLSGVMQPRLLELRRLVISEANRFPDLGRAFYEAGPGRTMQALAAVFRALGHSGGLTVEDPARAAMEFNWLLMSEPLNRVMLLGAAAVASRAEIESYADASVRTFLAAYGASPSAGSSDAGASVSTAAPTAASTR